MESCKVIECLSARELLQNLSPRSEFFDDSEALDWIFRGHANADWTLHPTAFRSSANLLDRQLAMPPWPEWRNRHQVQTEAATLLRFVNEADRAGLPVPYDLAKLRVELNEPREESRYIRAIESGEAEWPPEEIWPVVALAQHYGLATRFLDWTRHPLAAAYFASIDSLEQQDDVASIAVWAFSTESDATRKGLTSLSNNFRRSVAVVTAPYASNPNLRAQEGVHVARPLTRVTWDDPAERYDLAAHLEEVGAFGMKLGRPALLKFVAPRSESPALLWYLAREGVSAARLFPGYAGAARSVLEAGRQIRPKTPW
jgi:hypothetical protein